MTVRVLLVDDQQLIRAGFRVLLDAAAMSTWSARRPMAPEPSTRRDGFDPTSC